MENRGKLFENVEVTSTSMLTHIQVCQSTPACLEYFSLRASDNGVISSQTLLFTPLLKIEEVCLSSKNVYAFILFFKMGINIIIYYYYIILFYFFVQVMSDMFICSAILTVIPINTQIVLAVLYILFRIYFLNLLWCFQLYIVQCEVQLLCWPNALHTCADLIIDWHRAGRWPVKGLPVCY